MHIRADAVQETSNSVGTGPIALGGATSKMQPFGAVMGEGDTCYCRIEHQTHAEAEECIATMSGGALVRGAVLFSTAGGSAHVSFSSGNKLVSLVGTAGKALEADPDGAIRATANFIGSLQSVTRAPGTSTTDVATTKFVGDAVAALPPPPSLAPYAPLNSPAFTGNPTAPTPPRGDNDNSIVTSAFVQAALFYNSPHLYGAAMDGITDDTAALQSALAAGRPVLIDGPMLISNVTATINGNTIVGVGASAKFIAKAGSTGDMLDAFCDDFRIEGITFENLNSPGAQYSLWVSGNRYRIRRCKFLGQDWSPLTPSVVPGPLRQCNVQSHGGYTTTCDDGLIEDVYISGGFGGLVVSGPSRRSRFSKITAYNCQGYGFTLSGSSIYECQVDNYLGLCCGAYSFSTGGPQNVAVPVDTQPLFGLLFTNMYATNCGWGRYLLSINGSVGSKMMGYDFVCTNMYGTRFSGEARDCAGGGMETKGTDSGYVYTAATNASAALGATQLKFASGTAALSSVMVNYLVSGTNIPPDCKVQAVDTISSPNTVTLTRPTTGTVASGATITFTPGIQPQGDNANVWDLNYVCHNDTNQVAFWALQEDSTRPSGRTRNQQIKVHATQEMAIPWSSSTPKRKFDMVSDGGLGWLSMKAATTGMNYPSKATAGATSKTVGTAILNSAAVNLVSAAGVASGTTIPFASTTGIANGQTVAHPNVPLGTTVVSFIANTSVTISNAVTGAGILAGDTVNFGTLIALDTTGVTTGMSIVGPNVPLGCTVTSVQDATHLTLSAAIATPGWVVGTVLAFGPVGHVVLTSGAGNVDGATSIAVTSTVGAQPGMTLWGNSGIPDGTKINSILDSTHIDISPAHLTQPPGAVGWTLTGLVVAATVVNDGSVDWMCLGADGANGGTTPISGSATVVSTYGCANMVLDLNSSGFAYGLNVNTTSGTDNIYNGLKAKIRAFGAYVGVNVGGTGTLSDAVFEGCDIEAWQAAMTLGPSVGSDILISGGRWKTTHPLASQYALRINNGSNVIRLDGGVVFQSNVNALLVAGGANTLKCGSATFDGSLSSGQPVLVSGGSGTLDWGNAIIFNRNAAGPGYKITGGTLTTTGRAMRQDMTTAPTSTKQGSVGEYMILATPGATELGYQCVAADYVTPLFTWLPITMGITTVATLAALKALTSRPLIVHMQGFTTAGDGGGGTFVWYAGDATTPSDAMVVQCTAGAAGRYKRLWDLKALVPEWFGAKGDGVTDDTTAFTNAATFNATLLAFAPLHAARKYLTIGITINNLPVIDGLGTGEFVSAASMNGQTKLFSYTANGTVLIQNLKATLPLYMQAATPSSGGGGGLLATLPTSGTVAGVTVLNVSVVGGGHNAFDLHGTSNIVFENVFVDRCWANGIYFTSAQDTITERTHTVTLRNCYVRAAGHIGIIGPDNGLDVARLTPTNITIRAKVEACGWSNSNDQAMVAVVGSGQGQVVIDVDGLNPYRAGVVTVKRNVDFSNPVPALTTQHYIRAVGHTYFDNSYCINVGHDTVGTPIDVEGFGQTIIELNGTKGTAPPRVDGALYQVGDCIMVPTAATSGYSQYVCLISGVAGTGTGPTGRVRNTPYTDGGVTWFWVEDPTVGTVDGKLTAIAVGMRALNLNGSIKRVVGTVRYTGSFSLAQVTPIGAVGGDFMHDIRLDLRGLVTGCVLDDTTTLGPLTVNRLSITGAATTDGSGLFANGKALFNPQGGTYNDFVINGGDWRSSDAPWQIYFLGNVSTTAPIDCKIAGAPNISCSGGLIFSRGPLSVRWAGGGNVEIKNAVQAAVYGNSNASGTIEIADPVRLVTDAGINTIAFRGTLPIGTGTFNTRFIRGFASALPTGYAGAYGDFFVTTAPVAGTMNGWGVTTPASANATYTAF